jgi:hypothetical protein
MLFFYIYENTWFNIASQTKLIYHFPDEFPLIFKKDEKKINDPIFPISFFFKIKNKNIYDSKKKFKNKKINAIRLATYVTYNGPQLFFPCQQ